MRDRALDIDDRSRARWRRVRVEGEEGDDDGGGDVCARARCQWTTTRSTTRAIERAIEAWDRITSSPEGGVVLVVIGRMTPD